MMCGHPFCAFRYHDYYLERQPREHYLIPPGGANFYDDRVST